MLSRFRITLALVRVAHATSFHAAAQRGAVNIGQPLDGLSPALSAAFSAGARVFTKRYTIADGLGPVFNDDSCADCHRTPAIGAASNRLVTRFGRDADGFFDPLIELGGSLIQTRGIGSVTTPAGSFTFTGERIPADAIVVSHRRTTGLQGLGLVDAVSDDTWFAIATRKRRATRQRPGGRPSFSISRRGGRQWASSDGRRRCRRCTSSPATRSSTRAASRTRISRRRTVPPATARCSTSTRRRP